MLICFLFLLTCLQPDLLNAIKVSCDETYQTQNGSHCYPCSPGYHKYSDCLKNNGQDLCSRCPDDEYQPNCDDSTKCIKCSPHCLPGEIKVHNCSAKSDIKCECKNGTFEVPDPLKPDEKICQKHSKCNPGEGVEKLGTPYHDTICRQCTEGITFSDGKSFNGCTPCSVCNTTSAQACTLTTDTVCNDQAAHKPSPTETPRTHTGFIIGGVVFVVVVVAVIAGCIYRRRRRRNRNTNSPSERSDGNSPESIGLNTRSGNVKSKLDERDGNIDSVHRKHEQNGFLSNEQSGLHHGQSPSQSQNREEANNESSDEKEKCACEMLSLNECNPGSNDGNDLSTDAQAVPPRSSECLNENKGRLSRSTQTKGERSSMNESMHERVPTNNDTSMPSERSDGNSPESIGLNTRSGNVKSILDERDRNLDSVHCKPEQNGFQSNGQSGLQHEQSPLQSTNRKEANNERSDEKEKCAYEMLSLNKCNPRSNGGNDLSMDAQAVPPRSSECLNEDKGRLSRSTLPKGERSSMNESMHERVPTNDGTSMPSERSDGNGRSKALGGIPSSIPDTDNEEKVWMLMFDFLSKKLAINDFKRFYRWLTVHTNKDLAETKDVDIDRVISENCNDLKESMYKLMEKWRQATSNALKHQVLDALERAQLYQVHDKLLDFLTEKGYTTQ